MTPKGSAAEGILLKMLLQHGIEAEHGSPSRPGDIIVPPNVIIEVKDTKGNSYSFKQHSAKGEAQWKALKEKKERFPWLEVFYVVRFGRNDWRSYTFPEGPTPLPIKKGIPMEEFLKALMEGQIHYAEFAEAEVI